MSTSTSIVKSAIVILFFSTLEIYATIEVGDHMDLFFGQESFDKNSLSFAFASCAKSKKDHESWEKICSISRINNIFDVEVYIACGVTLESKIRETVVGTNVKVVSFGYNRAITQWVEKYEGESTLREAFVWFTITKFDNSCGMKKVKVTVPLDISENADNVLDKVYLVFDEGEDIFHVAYYDEKVCGNKICEISFDDEGNTIEELKPWFSLEKGVVREVVSFKRRKAEFGYLVISDVPESYLVDENGSKIRKLDIDSEENSKVIYSTDQDSISICYHLESSLTCGRFTLNGELQMKKSFQVQWKIEDGAVHYLPKTNLLIFTYSDSKKCKGNKLREHVTLIDNDDVVTSHDKKCRSRSITMPQFFYSENYKNQLGLLECSLVGEDGKYGITRIIRRFPFGTAGINLHSHKDTIVTKNIPVFFKGQ